MSPASSSIRSGAEQAGMLGVVVGESLTTSDTTSGTRADVDLDTLAELGPDTAPGIGPSSYTAAQLADDPVAAAAGLARLQHALFGQRQRPPQLARYLLLQRLSAGGMGVIYRAYDPTLDRPVAVKLIETEDPRTAERSLAEAHALAALSHPNVVRIFDVGTFDGTAAQADPQVAELLPRGGIFLVLELIEGQTLGQWVTRQTPDWRQIRDAYVQAGRGLMAAHAQGLVHHDFKPANAVRGDDGRVRVLDFGLAREASIHAALPNGTQDDDPNSLARIEGDMARGMVTQAGDQTRAAGTPVYMAPEQHDGGLTGPATDQFAFCTALYEALYGQRPFVGDDVASLGEAKRRGQVEIPSGHAVPSWVGRTLLRGLECDPTRRWPSMDALLRALQRDRVRARRLRAGLGVGLAVAAVAGIVGLSQALHDGPEDVCVAPARGLHGVWDDERKAQAQRAFEAVSRRYALSTWAMVEGRLDAYRNEWIEHMAAACDEDAPLDDELRALSRQCLGQRRRELLAVVDVLVGADEGIVDHAPATVASLRALGRCVDPTQLVMSEVLPEDPQRRAAVEQAQAELSRGNALRLAGRTEEAVALAESILTQAEALDHPPLRADALRNVAQARLSAGDEQGGLQALRDSVAVALSTNNHRSAGWSWMDLVYDEVHSGSGYSAALELVPVAERAVERSHDSHMLMAWLNSLGAMHLAGGDIEQGLAILRRAEAMLDEDFGPLRTLRLHENLAAAYAHLEHWDIAEAKQRELLAQVQQTLGEGHPDEAVAQFNMAAILFHQGRYEPALAAAERSIDILRTVYGHHPLITSAYGNIAEIRYAQGDLAGAREAAQTAFYESSQVEGGTDHAESGPLHLMADIEDLEGNLEQAHHYRSRKLALSERQHGKDSPILWLDRLGLAELGARMGRPAKARATLAEAEQALRERPEGLTDRRWCFTLSRLGEVHAALEQTEAAIAGYERALRCAEDLEVDADHRALYQQNLAEVLLERDRERAVALMRQAVVHLPLVQRPTARAWLEEHAAP